MHKKDKILVAGAAGMVGSALVRALLAQGYENILGTIHRTAPDFGPEAEGRVRLERLDLLDQQTVRDFFDRERPNHVFLAAAKVGGIHANNTYPAEFIHDNLVIQTNVIHNAYLSGVDRLLFLGSSCIYPKHAPQPMKEEYLLTGPLEPTNEPYAIAKIAGIKMCESYNRQYGTKFVAVMPTNLYGPGDNYHPENSHVIPALIRRFHEAKVSGAKEVVVWGTGNARREFLHVDDMADACLFVMNLPEDVFRSELLSYPKPCFVNVGTGEDMSIRELVELVKKTVRFDNEIIFDDTKPEGMSQKLLDIRKLIESGWNAKNKINISLQETIKTFMKNL